MPDDLTLLIPRKDLTDVRWNRIDEYTASHTPDALRVTGNDPWHPPRPYWSMSRAINDARTRATTSKLLITPCDYIHYPETLELISAMLDEHPWWQPYGGLIHLRQFEAARRLSSGNLVPPNIDGRRTNLALSAIAIRTDMFDDAAGMDPFFEGFSPEDYAFHITLNALYGAPPPPQDQWLIEIDSPRVRANFGTALKYCDENYYCHVKEVLDASEDPRQRILRPTFNAKGRKAIRSDVERRRGMTLEDRQKMDERYPPNIPYRPKESAEVRQRERRRALIERRGR